LNSIELDDYNFDGHMDFSVYESDNYSGNTTKLYFLYNPKTKSFFLSEISGVSLEFNPKSKRIYEEYHCCLGSIWRKSTYKIINNKMVLIKAHCYIYNHKLEKHIERPLKECR
jgi:hypothetical protein